MSNEKKSVEDDLGFTLNDKNYSYADLKDEDKEIVQQLKDLQMQLERIEFQHRQASGSKQHFTDLLIKSVDSEFVETKSDAEPTQK